MYSDNDAGVVQISLKKVVAHPMFCSIVKETARRLIDNPYLSPGDFFQSLSDIDVAALSMMAESVEQNDESSNNLLILAEMLANAEGVPSESDEISVMNLSYLISMIVCTSLHRKGLISADYKNMSFGDDMAHAIVARRLFIE